MQTAATYTLNAWALADRFGMSAAHAVVRLNLVARFGDGWIRKRGLSFETISDDEISGYLADLAA
ncbi:hypothetical protein DYI37_03315 [Fulvimarina endophytica]|uniref:Uncharacterized protein n=1 Tax=Fulvimarina endophytica TaxID=2293836 RepID=A0A371XB67_9HYPH|nr:hypothetical protein [Fulvimarina endophytica]RFC66485.1 hypothetical protein DYI37_03315 [Fulvimarina endophytica]